MIVLDTTIVNVALPSIRSRSRLLGDLARVGRERLPAHLRRLPAARRAARRPVRPPAAVPRGIALFTLASLACGLADSKGLLIARAGGAGARRRDRLGGRALADHDPVHRAGRAREGDGRLRLRRLAGGGSDRRAARRRPHRRARLALDLPRQPPDRRRGLRPRRCGSLPAARGHGRHGPARRRGRGHGHRCADARRLRDRERQPGRLDVGADARPARARPRCCWRSSS